MSAGRMPHRKPTQHQEPRNARAIHEAIAAGSLKPGDSVVVSFIGSTPIQAPHVFVDSGRTYDWRCLKGLHVNIVVRPGIDAKAAMHDLWQQAEYWLSPYLIDFDSKVLATIATNRPLTLWPERHGSYAWRQLFE